MRCRAALGGALLAAEIAGWVVLSALVLTAVGCSSACNPCDVVDPTPVRAEPKATVVQVTPTARSLDDP